MIEREIKQSIESFFRSNKKKKKKDLFYRCHLLAIYFLLTETGHGINSLLVVGTRAYEKSRQPDTQHTGSRYFISTVMNLTPMINYRRSMVRAKSL